MGDGFAKNTTVLAVGNIASQVISIALITVVTRIYSAEEFGEFSIIIALAMMLIPVSSLRFNATIILPENDSESSGLVRLSLIVSIVFTLLLFLIVFLFGEELIELAGLSDTMLLYFLPLIVMLGGWQLIVEAWVLRKKEFIVISLSGIGSVTGDRLTGIISGLVTNLGAIGLLLGRVTGLFLNVLLMVIGYRRTNSKLKNIPAPSINDLVNLCRHYRSFPIYSWAAMLQQVSKQAPIFLLGVFYSPLIAGLYALSFRVLAEPVQIVGSALGRGFAQRAAHDKAKGLDISDITLKLFKYLLVLIVVPMTILAIIAPEVFGLIFGKQWQESGVYVQYVAPVFMLTFVLRSLGSLFDVLRKQRDQFIFGLTLLIVSVGTFSLGIVGYSIEKVLIIYAVSTFLVLSYRILWLMHHAGIPRYAIVRVLANIVVDLLVFALPVYLVVKILNINIVALLALSLLIVIAYFVINVYRDPYLKMTIRRMVRK